MLLFILSLPFSESLLQWFLYFVVFFKVASADFHPTTVKDQVMVKHVYRVFNTKDWMCCLLECNGDSQCSSYNFEYDAEPYSGHICELSKCAMNEKREKGLIARRGFLFQQLKPSKNKDLCSDHRKQEPQPKVPNNCAEVLKDLKLGGTQSGVYSVDPDGKGAFKVYCDQNTSGGGWTVFQKRKNGSVDFYRGWNDYKEGFGDLTGEFWLGLDKIHRLTHQTCNRLRVELEDFEGNSAYAEYDYFAVSSEQNNYTLSLGTYSGTAGDSLPEQRNSKYADGVNWYHWKGSHYFAKRAEMKIRPV